ncbi:hypothetical protein DFH07DRAFT_873003 [Mycena maculata]|uniref:DUF6699 domain-containing protein n=1 Tax=Mycena maculata TaxID=230809 RepID=A0AAD7P2D3_9AGAR|nr:hypothetical protein DFH07DRAFT_873003 [Mycena maculata]
MDLQRHPWPLCEPPRNIDNLDTPWRSSPNSSLGREPEGGVYYGDDDAYLAAGTRSRYDSGFKRPERGMARILRALRRLMVRRRENEKIEERLFEAPTYNKVIHVPLSDWREFGEYSRPTVNGVHVHNTFTPSPTPYRHIDPADVDIEEVFASLQSPGGDIHPELWIPGIQHPSLPPPPKGWPLPRPGEPLAFPWECTLNPFLEHAVCGPAPVSWNIRAGPRAILYGGPLAAAIPLSPADLAQPATRPLLTHMFVSGLALADARFPWKFMVVNAAGIRVRDVFSAITDNFAHHVFRAEYERWTPARQRHAELEWELRGGPATQDGLRRIDYLCGHLYFRGLAPNPDRTGWVLFVGAEW